MIDTLRPTTAAIDDVVSEASVEAGRVVRAISAVAEAVMAHTLHNIDEHAPEVSNNDKAASV